MSDLAFRLRVRNQDDTADLLVVTSLAGGTNPYIAEAPSGDGASLNPLTGEVSTGAYRVRVIDPDVGGGVRPVTSVLVDATNRPQLLSKRAFIEQSTDDGATWTVLVAGYVNACRLTSPLVYEITVGETQRIEVSTKVFQRTSPTFNRVCCLIGGPIIGDWGPIKDTGPCRWRVETVGTTQVRLVYVSGWWPVAADNPTWQFTRGTIPDYARTRANSAMQGQVTGGLQSVVKDVAIGLTGGSLPGVEAAVYRLDGTLQGLMMPQAPFEVVAPPNVPTLRLISLSDRLLLNWVGTLPSVGDQFDLYVYPVDVSESNPLHIHMHPVDLWTGMRDDAGISYDTAAAASIRAQLGPNLRLLLRLTEAMPIADADRKLVYAPFGLAYRMDAQGRQVLISTRIASSGSPSTTWTINDLRDAETTSFDLDESEVCNHLTLKGKRFVRWTPDAPQTRSVDDVVTLDQSRTADNSDPGAAFGDREIIYEIPGTITNDTNQDGDLLSWVTGIAPQIFDRYGRGPIKGTLRLLRTAADVALGDEVIVDLPYRPNNATRGGPRILQVIQKTVTAAGPESLLLDSGTAAQTALVPTFGLATDPDDPKHVAVVTLTNVSALVSAYGSAGSVQLQYALGSASPSGDGLPFYSARVTEIASPFQVRTPKAAPATIVAVRARTFVSGQRPSAWSAWASVTLDAIPAAGTLTATIVGGDRVDLSWPNTDTTFPVKVVLRKASESVFQPVTLLPPGSATYELAGLATGTAYVAGVQLVTPDADAGQSTLQTVSFTTGVSALTCATPSNPRAWAYRTGTTLGDEFPGAYGLSVRGEEPNPSNIVFEEAVETSAGSGTYGAFAEVKRVFQLYHLDNNYNNTAPHDGKRRKMRAKCVRDGANDSAYTPEFTVLPYSGVDPQDYPLPAPAVTVSQETEDADGVAIPVLVLTWTPPTDATYGTTRFTVAASGGTGTIVVNAVSGPVRVPARWNTSYTVTPYAVTASGVVGPAGTPVVRATGNAGMRLPKTIPFTDAGGGGTRYPLLPRTSTSDPHTLDALPDGTQYRRMAQAHAGSLRSIQSSQTVLTAFVDTGHGQPNGYVVIAAHTVQHPWGLVSYNAGETLHNLVNGNLYYIYANDPNYEGGVNGSNYQPLRIFTDSDRQQLVAAAGRYFVGSIMIPTSGSTTGGGGGGAGKL